MLDRANPDIRNLDVPQQMVNNENRLDELNEYLISRRYADVPDERTQANIRRLTLESREGVPSGPTQEEITKIATK